jgi:hyperosmotically inducible periplasmic protein
MRKTIVPLIFLLAVLVASTAWAAGGAAAVTPAGRSAGQVIDDGTITTQVKAKLLEDSVTKGLAVSVKTFEGAVTLTGAVDSDAQREKAVQIASAVSGVKKVNNLINLKKSGK